MSLIEDASIYVHESDEYGCEVWSIQYIPGITLIVSRHNMYTDKLMNYLEDFMGCVYLIVEREGVAESTIIKTSKLQNTKLVKGKIKSLVADVMHVVA